MRQHAARGRVTACRGGNSSENSFIAQNAGTLAMNGSPVRRQQILPCSFFATVTRPHARAGGKRGRHMTTSTQARSTVRGHTTTTMSKHTRLIKNGSSAIGPGSTSTTMRCAARVAEDDPPGAYVCIWASSGVLPHGSKLLTPTSTVPPIPFLPWGLKDQLLRVARNLWQQRGPFLGIYVPISAVVVKRLSEKLWKDIHEIGGAVSCAKVGILRGGGIAHAAYASAIRDMPVFEQIFRWVTGEVAQQPLPAAPSGDLNKRLAGESLRIGLLTAWVPREHCDVSKHVPMEPPVAELVCCCRCGCATIYPRQWFFSCGRCHYLVCGDCHIWSANVWCCVCRGESLLRSPATVHDSEAVEDQSRHMP